MAGCASAVFSSLSLLLVSTAIEITPLFSNFHACLPKGHGKEMGASPLQEPLVLMPGDHVVEISLSGHAPIIKRITTISGAEDRVTATFKEPKCHSSPRFAGFRPGKSARESMS
jgi:hypothetical protein